MGEATPQSVDSGVQFRSLPKPTFQGRDAAIFDLLNGKLDGGIVALEWMADRQTDAGLFNDLAVAHLMRGLRDEDAESWIRALEMSRRAFELEPDLPETCYNFALVLSALHLQHKAREVWRRFLEIEPQGPWANHGRQWLARRTDTTQRPWQVLEARLRGDNPLEDVDWQEAALDHPHRLRELAETQFLGRWAHAFVNQDLETAGRWLDRWGAVSEVLTRTRQDRLPADEMASIAGKDFEGRHHHAQAWLRLLDAKERYAAQDFAAATKAFAEATDRLHAASSPYALVAELYGVICRFYADASGVSPALEGLLDRTPSRYPSLRGRVLWMLGNSHVGARQFERARQAYQRALPWIRNSEGEERAASLELLLAQTLSLRGEFTKGWNHRWRAWQSLSQVDDPQRRHGALFEWVKALSEEGVQELALLFLDEMRRNAVQYDLPSGEFEIQRETAAVMDRLGRSHQAQLALDEAERLLPSLDETVRQRMAASLDLVAGRLLLDSAPQAALHKLERAREGHERTGFDFYDRLYLMAVAESHGSMGRTESARTAWMQVVELDEQARRSAATMESKMDSFRMAQKAFDRLIEQAWGATRTEAIEAFYWAEKSRAQSILDAWSNQVGQPKQDVPQALEVVSGLDPWTTLVEFFVLDERILVWVLDDEDVTWQELAVTTEELAEKTLRFREALEGKAGVHRLRALGAELFTDLLEPLELDFQKEGRTILVPDGVLRDLPFMALVDPTTDEFLIEKTAVAVSPSAALFLRAEDRRPTLQAPLEALIVGVPRIEQGPYRFLPALPAVRDEVKALASRFPGTQPLLGAEASVQAVLDGLDGAHVFHFAGHAVASERSRQASALVLFPQHPSDDGALSVSEALQRRFSELTLVTLSACSTLEGYDAGREGTLGVALSFFASGVPSVVGTQWDVEDKVSAQLMPAFYGHLEDTGMPSRALRLAILEWWEGSEEAWSSPSSWAGYVVLGG